MKHEALPHHVHVVVNQSFWRIVVPEVQMTAFRALGNMLEAGTLRQQSASRLLQDLWAKPSVFNTRAKNWPVKSE